MRYYYDNPLSMLLYPLYSIRFFGLSLADIIIIVAIVALVVHFMRKRGKKGSGGKGGGGNAVDPWGDAPADGGSASDDPWE
ncbi:MAG: hypothetical protein HFJ75_02360 [Eggerthellaceae bacterium]|nr:hypothetical protein [Eggerthellaceae bacterium]